MADLSLMQSEYLIADDEIQREHFQELNDELQSSCLDETMPPLQRVEKYAKSDQPFDRQMVPRVMQAAFRSAPPDQLAKDLPHLMQIISKIADDDENPVRMDLLEQIPNLAETGIECSTRCPALATLVADHLLPLIVRHLTTTEYHVLKVAQHVLLVLMERALVTRVQAEIQVCPTILSLSRREQEKDLGMDFQSGAVTLMSKMAPLLGRDVMERVFLHRFADLCATATFNTRKVCATHLSDFAAVVGKEAYEIILLPTYLSLCADENWSVRKACAEAAVGVSCVCPTAALRRSTLAPLYTRLLRDSSRWVRGAAFQGLGPFISTFAQQPGGVTTLSYNAQGDLVLMNKYGCEFEVHSITPAIEDMKHFGNMTVITGGESELDYGDGFSVPQNLAQRYTNSQPSTSAALVEDSDPDSDDGGLGVLDIDEDTLCEYNRAVKMACGLNRLRTGYRGWGEITGDFQRDMIQPTPMSRFGEFRQSPEQEPNKIDDNLSVEHESKEELSKTYEGQEFAQKNAVRKQLLKDARRDYLATLQHSGDQNESSSSIELGNKIILFKGDVLTTTVEQGQERNDSNIVDSKSRDDLEQYNSYYYWYVSPDMPLDPDIVDAGVPLTAQAPMLAAHAPMLAAHAPMLAAHAPMLAAHAPDVVPQREPLPSPSMNNLNNEGLCSSSSSSILRNSGGNICDLLSTTLNVVNTEINESATTDETPSNSSATPAAFSLNTLLPDDQPPNTDLNDTFTVPSNDNKLPTTVEEDEDTDDSTTAAVGTSPQQRIVPQQLIDHFISMTHRHWEEDTNPDIAYYCAYSLPAVALTLGSENWHLLQGTVESLAQHAYYKVRLTLASCLHELAVILGQEIASECLTVIFDGFIKDLDEVRIGILKHMAHFLILISPQKRRHYLGLFVEFLRIDNQLNWRFQLQLAIQLRLAVPLYRPLDVLRHIFSIGLVLLHHEVAVARRTAIMLVTEVFKYCNKKKKTTSNLLVKVAETLAHATLWKLRQTFAMLAAELVRQEALPAPVFAVEVLPHLLDLSWDPVAVVRLSVGRTIATHIITNDYYKDPANQHHDTLQTVLRRLQADKDRDVRDFSTLATKENDVDIEGTSQQ